MNNPSGASWQVRPPRRLLSWFLFFSAAGDHPVYWRDDCLSTSQRPGFTPSAPSLSLFSRWSFLSACICVQCFTDAEKKNPAVCPGTNQRRPIAGIGIHLPDRRSRQSLFLSLSADHCRCQCAAASPGPVICRVGCRDSIRESSRSSILRISAADEWPSFSLID